MALQESVLLEIYRVWQRVVWDMPMQIAKVALLD